MNTPQPPPPPSSSHQKNHPINQIISNEDILKKVDQNQNNLIKFLSQMVSIDSTLEKGEGAVMDLIYGHLEQVFLMKNVDATPKKEEEEEEFEMEKVPINVSLLRNLPGFSPVNWEYGGKYNILFQNKTTLTKKSKQDNDSSSSSLCRSLILCGHADVVPCTTTTTTTTTSSLWTKCATPFTPTIHENRLYGRGSGDMKAGIACIIYALLSLRQLNCVPKAHFQIEIVCEEECTGNGCLAVRNHLDGRRDRLRHDEQQKMEADAVIIPEPFPFLVTAQLGVLWFQLHIIGKPAHVLDTSLGINAIQTAFSMYNHLQSTLQTRYNNSPLYKKNNAAYKDVHQPIHFNLGKINGGDWASSVPSTCTMDIRVGFFPSQSLEDVKKDVRDCFDAFALQEKEGVMKNVQFQLTYFGFQAEGAVLLDEFCGETKQEEEVKEESLTTTTTTAMGGKEKSKSNDCKEMQEERSSKKHKPNNDDNNNSENKAPDVNSSNSKSESNSSNAHLQKKFVSLLQQSHYSATVTTTPTPSSSSSLPLKPITCTTDARYYKLYSKIPCVTCYGPEATNIHGVDESVCLKSVRDVTATLALFIRDWCGLEKLE